MLSFLTTIRHPETALDYGRVEELLRATLASLCRQDHPAYEVVVVGNRPPAFPLPPPARFLAVAFDPPEPVRGTALSREGVLLDKGTKLAAGLLAADPRATRFMAVDADDLVSRRLAGLVAGSPVGQGWLLDSGWMVAARKGLASLVRRGFNDLCGTSAVVPRSLLPSPDLSPGASREEIFEAFGRETVLRLLGSHREIRRHCREVGRPLATVPFPAAAYLVETGENHSGARLSKLARPVPRSVAEDLGLAPGRRGLRAGAAAVAVDAGIVGRRVAYRLREAGR